LGLQSASTQCYSSLLEAPTVSLDPKVKKHTLLVRQTEESNYGTSKDLVGVFKMKLLSKDNHKPKQ
jgi:hypothetical protein